MIERKTIFSCALDPYARLVNAVQQDRPDFTATDVPLDLISLAERCLVKDSSARLDLVSWNDFERIPSQSSPGESAREKIRQRLGVRTAASPQPDAQYERLRVLRTTAEEIRDIIRGVCVSEALLPPLRVQELRLGDAAAHFTITFSPSQRFGLDVYFAFDFVILLVDPKSRAVIVNASAWLDVRPPDPNDSEEVQERIFAGFIQPDSMGNAILNFVLPGLRKGTYVASDRRSRTVPSWHYVRIGGTRNMNDTWWVSEGQMDDDQQRVVGLPLDKGQLVMGPPGSGKTNLLVLRAKYMTLAKRPNFQIVVFTRALREFIAAGASSYGVSKEKIVTSHHFFRNVLYQYGVKAAQVEDFSEQRKRLVEQVTGVVQKHGLQNLYDAILLDEAHDYLPEEIELFAKLGRTLYAVADRRQKIYSGEEPFGVLESIVEGKAEFDTPLPKWA